METDKSMTRPVLRRPDDDNDGLVALPPVPLVRQRLRASVKEFASSQPGRRAAALAAVWIAATGCEADLGHYDPEEALRTYRLIESELRAELRISLGRAITNEPHAATRNTMISMLEHLEELEVLEHADHRIASGGVRLVGDCPGAARATHRCAGGLRRLAA